jgi:RHS repeat-associated protein
VALIAVVVVIGAWRTKRRGPIVMLLLLGLTAPLLAEQSDAHAQPAADTFTYDHENRLVESVVDGITSTYAYNGDGLRVTRTADQESISYVWDVAAGLPVILQDSDGNTYVYGLDLISGTDSAGNREYYLYDGLGSTTELADSAGTVVGEYAYDVFGSVRSHTGSTTEWAFTGEQSDPNNLVYLRARYFDPSTGRFVTKDPIPFLNRYTYARNNPVRYVDPYGLFGLGDLNPIDNFVDCAKDPKGCAEDITETAQSAGNAVVDTVWDATAGAAGWGYGQVINPVLDAVDYCLLSSGDQFFECLERAEIATYGAVAVLAGGVIFSAGCILVPIALSPTGPGGWALAGATCLEASVGAAAGVYAGALIIKGAVSPWDEVGTRPKE